MPWRRWALGLYTPNHMGLFNGRDGLLVAVAEAVIQMTNDICYVAADPLTPWETTDGKLGTQFNQYAYQPLCVC